MMYLQIGDGALQQLRVTAGHQDGLGSLSFDSQFRPFVLFCIQRNRGRSPQSGPRGQESVAQNAIHPGPEVGSLLKRIDLMP